MWWAAGSVISGLAVCGLLYRIVTLVYGKLHSCASWPAATVFRNSIALLVIAHPDDESMFFTPTMRALITSGWRLHVLCISRGKFRDQCLF